MSYPSPRISRRQFVATVATASVALLAANGMPAAAAERDPSVPVSVRIGRIHHSGLDFRSGQGEGLSMPSFGGVDGVLTSAEPMAQFISAPLKLDFSTSHAALHWEMEGELEGLDLALRFSRDGTTWSSWRKLQIEHHGRAPTAPNIYSTLVGARGASWAQYRLTFGDNPGAVSVTSVGLVYFDAGLTPTAQDVDISRQSFSARLGPSTLLDQVITREQWGADESIRFKDGVDQWPRAFVTPELLVVHHTATDNDYADPAAEVRAIYTYHTVVQGFGDIGYHLLIDNRGQIYEGRRGREDDVDRPGQREIVSANVVAGHTLGFNYGSVGIALLGTFIEEPPTNAALSSLTQALAFEAERAGLDPTIETDVQRMRGTVGDNIFWRDGLSVVSGHQDCIETECPGERLYGLLPELRQSVAEAIGPAGPSVRFVRAPSDRNLWLGDLVFAWEALGGAAEFSTRLEGFRLSEVPDRIAPLSGYDEDERELWSEWTGDRGRAVALPPMANGAYTMMIRARDARGREGKVYARRTYIVGDFVLVDNEDAAETRRSGTWQHATQPMHFSGRGYELGVGDALFTWSLRVAMDGIYRLQACWTSDEGRTDAARYSTQINGVERLDISVDQRERGGTWVDLGRLTLEAGDMCDVQLRARGNGTVAADAVRLALSES
jgi:hypothetical protein